MVIVVVSCVLVNSVGWCYELYVCCDLMYFVSWYVGLIVWFGDMIAL